MLPDFFLCIDRILAFLTQNLAGGKTAPSKLFLLFLPLLKVFSRAAPAKINFEPGGGGLNFPVRAGPVRAEKFPPAARAGTGAVKRKRLVKRR
jgi:hypothetical protein